MPDPQVVRFGEFELDLRSGELARNGSRVLMPDQPLRLLALLIRERGSLVTRDELRRQLWRDDTFVDFEPSLNAAVKRLRETLGDSAVAPRFIETLPRRGYRFIAQVTDGGVAAVGRGHREAGGDPRPAGRVRCRHRCLVAQRRPAPQSRRTGRPRRRPVDQHRRGAAGVARTGRAAVGIRQDRRRPREPVAPVGRRGRSRSARPPRDGTFRSLTFGPNDFVYFTFFQPDQTAVGLYRVSVRGGEPEAISPATGGISFSADGSRYAYVSNMSVAMRESRIVIVDMDRGSERVLAIRRPPDSFLRTPPAWSPDGSRLGVFGVSDQAPAIFELMTIGVGDGKVIASARAAAGLGRARAVAARRLRLRRQCERVPGLAAALVARIGPVWSRAAADP